MITQDYILRQIHQLVQVLAAVLLLKRERDPEAAQAALAEGLFSATGVDLGRLRRMTRGELRQLCERGSAVSGDMALALADLLAEDADPAGAERAAWLYELAAAAGGPVPWEFGTRVPETGA